MSNQLHHPQAAANPTVAGLEEGRAWGMLFARGCAEEAQAYWDHSASNDRALLERLASCRTPVDWLLAQQAWLWAGAEAMAEATLRGWGVAIGSVSAAVADPKAFRLPD